MEKSAIEGDSPVSENVLCPTTPHCNRFRKSESTVSSAKQTQQFLPTCVVWAFPRSLATTYGIVSLSFPLVTEMFHFTRFRSLHPMYSGGGIQILLWMGYPIRKSPDRSVLAAPRSLSQLIASFIAYRHQGIHHVLFVAFDIVHSEIFCELQDIFR